MANGNIEYLEWDSEFFGKRIGRTNQVINSDSHHYDLLYIFSPKELDLPLLDLKINSELLYSHQGLPVDSYIVANETEMYRKEIEELCLLNGESTRFFLDPKLKPDYERLYLKWSEIAFDTVNHATWCYVEDDKILGFVCFQTKPTFRVQLSAVYPNYRRKGIAKKLWLYGMEALTKEHEQVFHISFQGLNKPAKQMYEDLGFQEKERFWIYHQWKD